MGTINPRHKKAIKVTLITAFFCLIPVTFLYNVTSNFSGSEFLKDVESSPFLMKQTNGAFFTNQSLIGKVTFLSHIPKDCGNCEKYLKSLTDVHAWSKEALKKLEHFEESDVQLERVIVSSDKAVGALFYDWHQVEESTQTLEDMDLLSKVCGYANDAKSIIFDRYGKIKACIPATEFNPKTVKSLLSKITFNTSMDEYLSERTFFGPKKSK